MTLLEQIEAAGIVGCGGAGFPTHVKLNCTVEYMIINAAECEPLLRTDRWLMIHEADKIVAAADMVGDMVQARNRFLALKETYGEEIAALEEAIQRKNSPLRLYKMKNFYPAGDEQIMVCDITGRSVPPSGIPLDVQTVVSNAATMHSIYHASQNQAFTKKYLTMTGAVASPCIVHAPLGTSFKDCLAMAGGSLLSSYHVVCGGPMMGKCYTKEEAQNLVVTKTTSGFIILRDDTNLVQRHELPLRFTLRQAKMSCIQCTFCTQMCPRYLTGHPLKPHLIMRKLAYAQNVEDILEDDHVQQAMICSECGICETYACPMGLQPRQVNIYVKNKLREKKFRYPKPAETFTQLEEREFRKISSRRLAARLEVEEYYDYHIDRLAKAHPQVVRLPLSQHIGAPSAPLVSEGDLVEEGQRIASIPPKSLGANLHASIAGTVIEVNSKEVVIAADNRRNQ